jgi:DNA-binding Lrp family transcriptional regulator
MSRINQVTSFIQGGYTPSQIRDALDISMSSVVQYMNTAIGAGLIKGYEILFSISALERNLIEEIINATNSTNWFDVCEQSRIIGFSLDPDIVKLYLKFRGECVSMKDMYDYISGIENTLHDAIKAVLIAKYGLEDWWRQGIPTSIRKTCVSLLEEDPEPAREAYSYTTFIHLQEILDKQWSLFAGYLPKPIAKDRKKFLDSFSKLNHIRNGVMHPIKHINLTEEDFKLAREFYEAIQLQRWQTFPE